MSFSSKELSTSISEIQSWSGVESYTILPSQFCPGNECRAEIKLLELGDTAVVGVSEKGWTIALRSVVSWERLPLESAAKDDKAFDTLEHLLAYLSPAFEKRRMEVLSERLQKISVQQEREQEEDVEAA